MIENILGLALTVIPTQEALLFRWQGREINAIGFDEDVFADPVPLTGSIQPIDRSRYGYMGLDASKGYVAVYCPDLVQGLTKTLNPDQIEYQGRRYRVMVDTDWSGPAGFTGVMAVDIGPAGRAREEGATHVHNGK